MSYQKTDNVEILIVISIYSYNREIQYRTYEYIHGQKIFVMNIICVMTNFVYEYIYDWTSMNSYTCTVTQIAI